MHSQSASNRKCRIGTYTVQSVLTVLCMYPFRTSSWKGWGGNEHGGIPRGMKRSFHTRERCRTKNANAMYSQYVHYRYDSTVGYKVLRSIFMYVWFLLARAHKNGGLLMYVPILVLSSLIDCLERRVLRIGMYIQRCG